MWDCEPIASSWGVHATGVAEFQIDVEDNREDIAVFLVGEALRQIQSRGVTMAEAQVAATNVSDLQVFQRLGFEQVDRAIAFRREASE